MFASWRCATRICLALSAASVLVACGPAQSSHEEPAIATGNADAIRSDFGALNAGAAAARPTTGSTPTTKMPEPDIEFAQPVPFDSFALQIVSSINGIRAEARTCGARQFPAAAPLRWHPRVAYAALLHSQWMQSNNAFDHAWTSGERVWNRLEMSGYDWLAADENIAAGFVSISAVMSAWLASPGHCAALMRDDVDHLGVALVMGDGAKASSNYWTMVLAAPKLAPAALKRGT